MAQFLRTKGISAQIENIIIDARQDLYLVTPYLQLSTSFFERLSEANHNKVNIHLVYGKNELNKKEQQQVESLDNLKLYFFENLHAKCYFNEKEMVITSMNLYEFSEKNNREMGVYLNAKDDTDLYQDAKKETESIILHSQVVKDKSVQATKSANTKSNSTRETKGSSYYQTAQLPQNGVCIRCQNDLPLNLTRPMCYTCFNTWRQFENPTYPENYCHICSKKDNVSMDQPICYGCYKKHEKEIQARYVKV